MTLLRSPRAHKIAPRRDPAETPTGTTAFAAFAHVPLAAILVAIAGCSKPEDATSLPFLNRADPEGTEVLLLAPATPEAPQSGIQPFPDLEAAARRKRDSVPGPQFHSHPDLHPYPHPNLELDSHSDLAGQAVVELATATASAIELCILSSGREVFAFSRVEGSGRWSIPHGEPLPPAGYPRGAERLAISPGDEPHAIAAVIDGVLTAGRLDGRAGSTALGSVPGEPITMAWSRDGSRFAAAFRGAGIEVWQVQEGKGTILGTLKEGPDAAGPLAFSPDGEHLLACGADGAVRLWSVTRRTLETTITGHPGGVASAVFAPDGRSFATAGFEGLVRAWSLDRANELWNRQVDRAVPALASHPSHGGLLTGGLDGFVRVWDWSSGEELYRIRAHAGPIRALACGGPDGTTIASWGFDRKIKVWDLRRLAAVIGMHSHEVWDVAVHPSQPACASAGNDGMCRLWTAAQGPPASPSTPRTLFGHKGGVLAVAFDPTGRNLATAGEDGTIRLWRVSGMELAIMRGHSAGVTCVAFSPDGTLLLSGGVDGELRLWGVARGELVAKASQRAAGVMDVKFHPAGRFVLSAGIDGKLVVWSVPELSESRVLGFHRKAVSSLASTATGDRFVSAGADGAAIVWDWSSTVQSLRLVHPSAKLTAVDVNSARQIVATGASDSSIRLWNLRTGDLILQLHGHGASVTGVAFSSDGTCLVSAGLDRVVLRWPISEYFAD